MARTGIKRAMDKTLAACVTVAMHEVPRDTGNLANDIGFEQAIDLRTRFEGSFGAYTVDYALAIELGAVAHVIRPRNKKALYWDGAPHPVKLVHHPGNEPHPFLRPAADQEFPKLADRIGVEMRRIFG
jgi:hypothetical protein